MNAASTLFVTDLDGTLLRPDATLAAEDAAAINRMTADGIRITYATARTVASVEHILSGIDFHADSPPVALMNGVLLRDMVRGIYVDRAVYSRETAQHLLDAMTAAGTYPFIYTLLWDGSLMTCYRDISCDVMRAFMEERKLRYGKPFRHIHDVSEIDGEIIYFCLVAPENDVRRAEEAVKTVPHIRYTSYRDHYDTSVFYLEIFDERASKRHAVEFLRRYTRAETVVCFGDNLNDLSMFEASDIRVAVANTHPDLMSQADFVADGGVPAFISEFYKKNFTS
ncbi:MAG: HAD family phosphatase [Clostridia bacterium]|nr:HAD family phosphatase [Clostridia bacterium]